MKRSKRNGELRRTTMEEYPKIQSIYKRDEKTHKFIEGEYSLPEFAYLKDNLWTFTEKIDGTNVRVGFDGEAIQFGGRTSNAQMPTFLLARLQELFTIEKLGKIFNPPDDGTKLEIILFGEGYGARIQKGGGNYIPDGVDFILFDIKIGTWWLKREDVEGIAQALNLKTVPIMGEGKLDDAVIRIKNGIQSTFGDFLAEGLVLKPKTELFTRSGYRIITKLKHKDF
jgi:ATP-dependent RNA circularization protein (DNA/RNA ligase family)